MAEKIFDGMEGARFAGKIILQSGQPLDARSEVNTYGDLQKLIDEHGAYEGMKVYVKGEKKEYRLKDLPGAVWVCEQDTVSELTNDIDALQDDVDGLAERKLEQKHVDDLLSKSAVYDFDDGKPLFSVPAINGAEKGTSSVVEDENGYYQAVEVGTGTIGSTSNVYSQFKLGSITENASKITLEFDFEYEHNGRMKLAIADLDVINSLSNSDIRWNTKGIAADIFSNSNNNFQINGKDALRASFFGTWLHAKFVMDFSERKVQYTITSKTNPADTLEGNVDFRDTDCAKITGIAVYTWLQNDKLYIDNINITALYDARENTRYIVGTGGVYKEYTYIDGVPVLVGRSDAVSPDGVKTLITDKADKRTANGGFAGGEDANTSFGGAIGNGTYAEDGGAVGEYAYGGYYGFAGGREAKVLEDEDGYDSNGAAVGYRAQAIDGGAVGNGAEATYGFSGGYNAKSEVDAIQLGTGLNKHDGTLQVYDHTLMNSDGTIPVERLKNSKGGFAGGDASFSGDDTSGVVIGHYATNGGAGGAAVGSEANVTGNGAAVGYHASAKGGGAIGSSATADNGFAGGMNASAGYGCAAGRNAVTKNGVAVGNDAKTLDNQGRAIEAIQLGTGTNDTEKTMQVYDYRLMNADGTIPIERLQEETDSRYKEDKKIEQDVVSLYNAFDIQDMTYTGRMADFSRFEKERQYLIHVIPDLKDYDSVPAGTIWFSDRVRASHTAEEAYYVNVTGEEVKVGGIYLFVKHSEPERDEEELIYTDGSVSFTKINMYDRPLTDYFTTPQRIGTWIDGRPIYRQVFQGVFEEIDIEDISQYGGKDSSGLSLCPTAPEASIALSVKTIYHIDASSPSAIDDIPAVYSDYSYSVVSPVYTSAELAAKLTAGVSGYTTIIEYVPKEV